MFIQTEATPNPATLKFLPGRDVAPGQPLEFSSRDDAGRSQLAAALFQVDGVSRVMFGADFISVTKGAGEWQHIKPAVLGAIMEHFMSGWPLLAETGAPPNGAEDEFYEQEHAEIVDAIKELLESRIRPAVAGDGGDITFRGFRDGVVYLTMKGACSGCPSSTATLKHGIENLLRHYVPEVEAVEQM
ncbi:MAG: NifU family protein [Beijerinckiaceae bacterium]